MKYSTNCMAWRWVDAATRRIRFSPDRARVYGELMAHMHDAIDERVAAGMDGKEAEARAVEAMGDAEEVAEHLARLYRPFWGFLWKYTRVPAFLAALYLLFAVVFGGLLRSGWLDTYDPEPYISQLNADNVDILADLRPTARARVCGYTVSVPRLRLWQTKDGGERQISFVLRMSSANPWLASSMFYRYVYATDDLGNTYLWRNYDNGFPKPETAGNLAHRGLFSSHAELWVSEVDRNATVITFRYDGFGQIFALEVPLEVTP
ncbi:MAG: hypothetical protein ABT01_04995 [Clostridium sp. SCN 57-10]|nr:MAG: hypothetical protein ABT01_04995 [Clostridium sp. SCN 57-10]